MMFWKYHKKSELRGKTDVTHLNSETARRAAPVEPIV